MLKSNGFNDFIHEFPIKVKDSLGTWHIYHLDFYFPAFKLAIEINPAFHYTYETVAIRDTIRNKLLSRKAHIKTLNVDLVFKTKKKIQYTSLEQKSVKKALKTLKRMSTKKPHKETLLAYH